MTREPFASEFGRAQSAIAGHVMSERKSRSFDFRTPGKGSIYAYSLTWTPGTFVLAGDIGELTITHWHAMHDFKAAIAWVSGSDWSYLLSKCGREQIKQIPDTEATVGFILELALSGDYPSLVANLKENLSLGDRVRGAALAAGLRARLTDEIHGMDERGQGEFCYNLGLDDYYGSTRTHPHHIYQINAMQRGAAMILAEIAPYEWL